MSHRMIVIAVIAALAGCSDSTSPAAFTGIYAMESAKGFALPTRDFTRTDGSYQTIAAGSMEVRPDSMIVTLTYQSFSATNVAQGQPFQENARFGYQRSGNTLTLTSGTTTTTGAVAGRRITIQSTYKGPWVFVR